MTKKKTKKQKEEYELQFEQQTLKTKKNVYDTYLKALVKYNMPSMAYSSIMYDDLYHNCLLRFMERNEHDARAFHTMMFGESRKKKPTEIELIQEEIEYYDKLIGLAEHRIDGLPDDIKMKIVKDSITKMHSWLGIPEMEKAVERTKVKVVKKMSVVKKGKFVKPNKTKAKKK